MTQVTVEPLTEATFSLSEGRSFSPPVLLTVGVVTISAYGDRVSLIVTSAYVCECVISVTMSLNALERFVGLVPSSADAFFSPVA